MTNPPEADDGIIMTNPPEADDGIIMTNPQAVARRKAILKVLSRLAPTVPRARLDQEALWLEVSNAGGAAADHPRARRGGSRNARRHLEKTVALAGKLHQSIQALPREALAAFEGVDSRKPHHPLIFADRLRDFVRAAYDGGATIPESTAPQGARPKKQARRVALAARDAYERLTGRRAGRITVTDTYKNGRPSSRFVMFLENIFGVFGISASADGQAHALLYPPKKRPAKTTR